MLTIQSGFLSNNDKGGGNGVGGLCMHTDTQTHNEDVAASPSAHLSTRIIFILQTMCQTTKKQNGCTLNNVASEYRNTESLALNKY